MGYVLGTLGVVQNIKIFAIDLAAKLIPFLLGIETLTLTNSILLCSETLTQESIKRL